MHPNNLNKLHQLFKKNDNLCLRDTGLRFVDCLRTQKDLPTDWAIILSAIRVP